MKYIQLYLYFNLIYLIFEYWRRSFASYSIYVTIISIVLIFCIFSGSKIKKNGVNKVVIFALFFYLICIPFTLNTFGIGSFINLFYFLLQFVLFQVCTLRCKDLCALPVLGTTMLIIYHILPGKDVNSNSISQFYFALTIVSTVLVNSGKIKNALFLFVIFSFAYYAIYLGESRMSFLSLTLYVFLRFLPNYVYRNYNIILFILLFFTVGSLIYVYIYTYLYSTSYDLYELESVMREYSKKHFFSGREEIWVEVLGLLEKDPITGFGSKINLESFGDLNIHNSVLAICGIYGCIIGGLCIWLMIIMILNIRRYLTNPIVKNCFSAYVASLFMGFNETYLINYSFVAFFPLFVAYGYVNSLNKFRAQNQLINATELSV